MDFNEIKVSATSLAKRSTLFALTQEEMYRNIANRDLSVYQRDGILMGLTGGLGLDWSASLRVERYGANTIKVHPGRAIQFYDDTIRMMILNDEKLVTLPAADGIYHIWITYAKEAVPTGSENLAPGKHHDTDSIYLARRDSASILVKYAGDSIESATTYEDTTTEEAVYGDVDGFLLGMVYKRNGSIPGMVTRVLSIPDGTKVLESNENRIYLTSYTGVPDEGVLRINNEHIAYTLGDDVLDVVARGVHNTNKSIHIEGDNVQFRGVLDLRQTNAAKIKEKDSSFIEMLKRGFIDIAGSSTGDRILLTSRIPTQPNIPAITSHAIKRLNDHDTSVTDVEEARDLILELQAEKTTIGNLLSDVRSLQKELPLADAADAPGISLQISDKQSQLAETQAQYYQDFRELNKVVSESGLRDNKYVAAIVITQPALKDGEQIVEYIAEVRYGNIQEGSIAAYHRSLKLLPDSRSLYGDNVYTYTGQPDSKYRTIYIPISFGERITVNLQAISEYGLHSDWSDTIEITYDDRIQDITDISRDLREVSLDSVDMAETSEQLVKLVQTSQDNISGLQNSVRDNESKISAMNDRVDRMESLLAKVKQDTDQTKGYVAGSAGEALPDDTEPGTV